MRRQREYRRNNYRRRGSRTPIIFALWIIFIIVAILLNAYYGAGLGTGSSILLWIPSYLAGFALGALLAIRVYRYAMRVSNVQSAWTIRILMTLGVLVTGFLLFVLLFSAFTSTLTLYDPTIAQKVAGNMVVNFVFGIDIFLFPIFAAFLAGEGYLLYRLRHHYTVSGW